MSRQFTADLKGQARTALLGKWAFLAGVFLLEFLFNVILEEIVGMAFPGVSFGITVDGHIVFSVPRILCMVIIGLLSTILSVGSMFLYLNICRGKSFRFQDLFYGFTHQPERIAAYYAVMTIISIVFGGIPAVFLFMVSFKGDAIRIIGFVVSTVICLVGYLYFSLRYTIFPFLYVDTPWKTSRILLEQSRWMMEGHKMRYLYLQLSFAGMLVLGILSFGVGMIWIGPYVTMTNTEFYLDLVERCSQEEGEFDYGNI